jgi:N-acetyl-gamma-glutamyl-phosphate reductase
MPPTIYIDGDQGTSGLRIVQRLSVRRDLRLHTLPPAQRKDPLRRTEALNACDIAILCLPDAAAREAVGWIENPKVRVIDASSAHRTDPAWVYGLPELEAAQPARIAAAGRVSNPGCYPTAAVTLLRPLRDAGLLPADAPLAIHAVSGYTGRGRAGIDAHAGAEAAAQPALQVYGLSLDHKHVPEIQQHARLAQRPLFVPAYGRFAQGIVLMVPLHRAWLPEACTLQRVHEALSERYAGHPQVQVWAPTPAEAAAMQLDPEALNDSDALRLMVFGDARGEHLLLAAVLDNLGKGAAGAAVQNLQLMLGPPG